MTSERDNNAAKDILSRLSKDDTLLEEIRKIALRGIINAQIGDHVIALPQSQDKEEENSDGRYSRQSPLSSSSLPSSNAVQRTRTEQINPSLSSKTLEKDEEKELAFIVSRDSETYRSILTTARWYRNALLVGSTPYSPYNNNIEQSNDINQTNILNETEKFTITNTPQHQDVSSAWAHPLLLSATENYLRSKGAMDFLRPYATWAVSNDGPMFPISSQSLAQSIPLAQTSCDNALKDNLLWVLQDEGWREFAKSITAKYVDGSWNE